jgi:hypothetical protein
MRGSIETCESRAKERKKKKSSFMSRKRTQSLARQHLLHPHRTLARCVNIQLSRVLNQECNILIVLGWARYHIESSACAMDYDKGRRSLILGR